MTKAFGIDLSRFNISADGTVRPDPYAFIANPERISFVAYRATISWGYQDAWFPWYWNSFSKETRIPRIAYSVPYGGEPAIQQMDNLFRALGKDVDFDHDRLCLDLEVAGPSTNTKYKWTNTLLSLLSICKSRTGRYPLVYSRANWINEHIYVYDLPANLDWWMAQYLKRRLWPIVYTPEHPGPPDLPIGVKTWRVHQTAEYTPSIGISGRKYMDYNRWNGDANDVLNYFGYDGEIPEPPEPPEPPEYLFQAKFKQTALTIRDKPKTGATVGYVLAGDVVNVYEVDSATGWYRIDPTEQVWCSGWAGYWDAHEELH